MVQKHQKIPDQYNILFEELNQLMDMVQTFSEDTQSQELKNEIQALLLEMSHVSKSIGGSVWDHTNDLQIDLNLFLVEPKNRQLATKMFQDFQLLENDLRSL